MKGLSIIFTVVVASIVIIVLGIVLLNQTSQSFDTVEVIKYEGAMFDMCIQWKRIYESCSCQSWGSFDISKKTDQECQTLNDKEGCYCAKYSDTCKGWTEFKD